LQLLGFPIQLFGLLLLPGAILKYLVEKESPTDDVRGALVYFQVWSPSHFTASSAAFFAVWQCGTANNGHMFILLQNNLAKRLPGLEKESF